MRGSSSHRKNKIQPELTHKIQSKLLISSVSRQTIPSAMLSRYTPQQHQQLLQKQYNMKFMTDRKRTSSAKKTSRNKHMTKNDSRGDTGEIRPKRLFSEEQEYRQKYNDLHETHLQNKQKWIGQTQKYLTLKQTLIDFLNAPSAHQQTLVRLLDSDKAGRQVSKLVESSCRGKQAEDTLREVMRVLQVQRVEDVMVTLRARLDRFRNLDECTYKILQLESASKQMVIEFDQKMRKIMKETQQVHSRQIQRLKDELEMARRSKAFVEEQLTLQREESNNLLSDLNCLIQCGQDCHSPPKWQSNRPQLIELYKLIRNLSTRLRQIEVDAEQNMLKLMRSNEQMVKLQQLMGLLRDDMTKQIEEQEENNQQNICEIRHLQQQIEELEKGNQELKEKRQEMEEVREKQKKEIENQRKLMASALGLKDISSAKITLSIQQLAQQNMNIHQQLQQLSDTISQKDQNITQLNQQLEKHSRMANELKETTKAALYEKEQYKFLLNNHRDQLSVIKQQHQQESAKMRKQNQEEIVRSNRDILHSYGQLKQQYERCKNQQMQQRLVFEENKIELLFIRGKQTQTASILKQKETELLKVLEENERYKKYLRQIEGSFKEMVDMEEHASKRVSLLEKEQQTQSVILKAHQTKAQQLQQANSELTQQRNELSTALESARKDVHELRQERIKLESTNVELRLETISKQSEINKILEQLKNTQKQSKTNKLANEKLMGELNSVTRKLVMFRLQFKNRHSDRFRNCKRELGWLREDQNELRETFTKEVSALKSMTVQMIEGIMKNVEILRLQWKRRLDEKEEMLIEKEEMLIEKDGQIAEYLNRQNTQNIAEQLINNRMQQLAIECETKVKQQRQKIQSLEDQIHQMGEKHELDFNNIKIKSQDERKQMIKIHGQQIHELKELHKKETLLIEERHVQHLKSVQNKYINQLKGKQEKYSKQLVYAEQKYLEQIAELEERYKKEYQAVKVEDKVVRQVQVTLRHPQQVNFNDLPSILSEQLSHTSEQLQEEMLIHIKETKVHEVGVGCQLLSPYDKAILTHRLDRVVGIFKQLSKDRLALNESMDNMNAKMREQMEVFGRWVEEECCKIDSERDSWRQKQMERYKERQDNEAKKSEGEQWKGDEEAILQSCGQNQLDKQNQANVVNHTLQLLHDNDSEIPNVPYWQKIKANFLGIRRKLTKKNLNFKLDISAIDNKQPPLHSPNSFSAGQNDFFKRFGSEPDQVLDLKDFRDKQTHRSEQIPNNSIIFEALKRQNQELRQKIMGIVDEKAEMEDKLEEQQITLHQMEAKLVSLQNETSIKGLEYNYKKLLDYLLQENVALFEQTCRVLMKMLHFQKEEIQIYEEKLSLKKKKRKSGLLNSFFKQ